MDKCFLLTVPVGTEIIKADGSRQILEAIPKNVLDLWEAGSRCFVLTEKGAEYISKFSKSRLEKILEVRKNLKYKEEIRKIENVIKALEVPKKNLKPDKVS